jgi:hypothetical protein
VWRRRTQRPVRRRWPTPVLGYDTKRAERYDFAINVKTAVAGLHCHRPEVMAQAMEIIQWPWIMLCGNVPF